MSRERSSSMQKEMAAVFETQHKVLERLAEGRVVELFLDFAAEIAPQRQSVEVRLSTPTGNPREVPTVSVVIDGKKRISAYEFVTRNGRNLFRLRQGFDDLDPESGAAFTLHNDCKIFSGEYGHHKSLKNASQILHDAANRVAAFNGGVSDISYRGGLMHRIIARPVRPLESPYVVLLRFPKR